MMEKINPKNKKFFAILILAIAISSIFLLNFFNIFKFSAFLVLPSKKTLIYLMPPNCPENVCNTDLLKLWSQDLGINLEIYESDVTFPSSFILKSNKAIMISTISKRAFMNDFCVLLDDKKACKIFEDSITKTNRVRITTFSSLFSAADINARALALQLANTIDKIDYLPRFVIFTNLQDPNAVRQSQELKEIMTQLCILREESNKWASYSLCVDNSLLQNAYTNQTSSLCMERAQIDKEKINECVKNNGLQLAAQEVQAVQALGLTRTPAIFINNDLYAGKLNYDELLKTICFYFIEKPEPCS